MPRFFQRLPSLTSDQANAQAQRLQTLAGSFQMQVEVDIPGDVTINPTQMLNLTGTGSAWDQSYYIDTVTHEFDFDNGFRTTIEAKTVDTGA